jgi:hypothetical protein
MLTEFILYLEEQIGEPYMWGGQHTKLTPYNYIDVITKHEKNEYNRDAAIAYCKAKFDAGADVLYAYDCSGLGMYWLENVKHIFKSDMTANSMMGQCEIVDEPKKGYWVFRLNDGRATHIGYMVSDTEVVHAAGRKLGVVKVPYKKSFWHRVGKPKCFDFDDAPEPRHDYEIKVKGSVRVRNGNGVLHKKIATVRNCRLPYVGQDAESPNWYITIVNGQRGWITSNPRYTEIVEVTW